MTAWTVNAMRDSDQNCIFTRSPGEPFLPSLPFFPCSPCNEKETDASLHTVKAKLTNIKQEVAMVWCYYISQVLSGLWLADSVVRILK